MPANANVMDVFLSVQVKDGDFNDVNELLKKLKKISKLESIIKSKKSKIRIDADTEELEKKIDDISDDMKRSLAITDDIKKLRTDMASTHAGVRYIIDRLWSVSTTTASKTQQASRLQGILKNMPSVVENFTRQLADPDFIPKKAAAVGMSPDEWLKDYERKLSVIVIRLIEKIKSGIGLTGKDEDIVGLIEMIARGKGTTPMMHHFWEQIDKLYTGQETTFQTRLTGHGQSSKTRSSTLGTLHAISQMGMKMGTRQTSKEAEAYFSDINLEEVTMKRKWVDRMIEAYATGTKQDRKNVANEIADELSDELDFEEGEFFEKYRMERGTIFSKELFDVLTSKETKDRISELNKLYTTGRIDEVILMQEKLIESIKSGDISETELEEGLEELGYTDKGLINYTLNKLKAIASLVGEGPAALFANYKIGQGAVNAIWNDIFNKYIRQYEGDPDKLREIFNIGVTEQPSSKRYIASVQTETIKDIEEATEDLEALISEMQDKDLREIEEKLSDIHDVLTDLKDRSSDDDSMREILDKITTIVDALGGIR